MPGTLIRQAVLDRRWKLFKAPVAASETNLTATQVQSFPDTQKVPTYNGAVGLIDVHPINKLRARFYGKNANSLTATLQLFGWYEDGPGHHIGTVTLTLGSAPVESDSANNPFSLGLDIAHPSLKGIFGDGAVWREVRTYTIVDNFENILVARNTITDLGAYLEIDLTGTGYHYLLPLLNLGTMTECGGIWIPVS